MNRACVPALANPINDPVLFPPIDGATEIPLIDLCLPRYLGKRKGAVAKVKGPDLLLLASDDLLNLRWRDGNPSHYLDCAAQIIERQVTGHYETRFLTYNLAR